MNSKSLKLLFFVIAFVAFVLNACFESSEKALTETQVPSAILKAFNQAYPKAILREYKEEIEDGQKFYEISFRKEGHKIDVLYSQDGVVIEISESISLEELPLAIQNELNKSFSKYEIEESEKISKDTDIFYEVELMVESDGEFQKYEIVFSEDGRVVEEKKDEENDDEDEDR